MTRIDFLKTLIMLAIGAIMLVTGCDEQRPVAIVYIEDPGDSCKEGRAEFHRSFERLFAGGYLSNGQICIIHACSKPHVLYAGPARRAKEAKSAFESVAEPCPYTTKTSKTRFCGSNMAGALAIAKAWLAKQEFENHRRVVVAWTALISEPCTTKRKRRNPRAFSDPLNFSWAPVQAEVHLYGLPAGKHEAVKKAWKDLEKAPCCHLPFETFEPQHLGLQAKVL